MQSTATDGSDHCPRLLGLNDVQPSKARFHFESFWPTLDGFQETVELAWSSVQATSCPFDTQEKSSRQPSELSKVGVGKKLHTLTVN